MRKNYESNSGVVFDFPGLPFTTRHDFLPSLLRCDRFSVPTFVLFLLSLVVVDGVGGWRIPRTFILITLLTSTKMR